MNWEGIGIENEFFYLYQILKAFSTNYDMAHKT